MSWKIFFSFMFFLIAIFLLAFYWFFPFNTVEFYKEQEFPRNFNFTLNNSEESMQFYENMRFPKKEISYNITDCPLQKEYDMKRAFETVSNLTILRFYPTNNPSEISVTCEERQRQDPKNGFFIAGEGGPANITNTTNFNVIIRGEVLLIRNSGCPNPNVGIHELFHALGFKHSPNPGSIMYEVTSCGQQIGSDLVNEVNRLYSIPSYADLAIENASAIMHGKYLDANVTVRNHGLSKTANSTLAVYADGKKISEISINELKIGFGTEISFRNLVVLQLNTKEIEFSLDYQGNELEKGNNKIKMEIKK